MKACVSLLPFSCQRVFSPSFEPDPDPLATGAAFVLKALRTLVALGSKSLKRLANLSWIVAISGMNRQSQSNKLSWINLVPNVSESQIHEAELRLPPV